MGVPEGRPLTALLLCVLVYILVCVEVWVCGRTGAIVLLLVRDPLAMSSWCPPPRAAPLMLFRVEFPLGCDAFQLCFGQSPSNVQNVPSCIFFLLVQAVPPSTLRLRPSRAAYRW